MSHQSDQPQSRDRRVVVTGLGLVTPIGIGVQQTFNSLLEGRSGVGTITQFDTEQFPVKIAAEVKGFDATQFVEKKLLKQTERFIDFALAASVMALESAGLENSKPLGERVGTIIGVGIGGLSEIERTHKVYLENGPRRISPFFIPRLIANLAAGQVAILTGARGPINCTVTACSASSHAVGEAFRLIQRGDADVMITGGSESCITDLAVGGFAAMRALSRRNDEPEKASRPFDKERDGFVMGEGSGILILESYEHALSRGQTPLAEIVGYGMSCDGYHITAPAPEAEGAQRCMKAALKDAGMEANEVDYINAHGTSTQLNDSLETIAIKKVFGDHAQKLSISSTKSMTGHLLGAAGGVEAAISVLTLREGVVPPTINQEVADPECDLNYTANKATKRPIQTALSNSFGFGGANASLLFRRIES